MGKDLEGKELGVGISQRRDGRYIVRFTNKDGKRIVKYFMEVQKCREWIDKEKLSDEINFSGKNQHAVILNSHITVDDWFDYWINNIKSGIVRYNTKRNYTDRYNYNIKNKIGGLLITSIKPMHCQKILNDMEKENYAGATMEQTRITMYNMFDSAFENEIIMSNPVKRSVKCPRKAEKRNRVLTLDEQKLFLETAKGTSNYLQYQLVLQTGIRAGELIGLKWEDIDFESREITIRRTVCYSYTNKKYIVGEPKSESGYRVIPMTQIAYNILKEKQKYYVNQKQSARYNSEFADYVFVNRNGVPTKNPTYDSHLNKIAVKAGIPTFSMHTLRHTFATRCIEAGMKPKTLQKILGHSNISITMNLYVHVTDDEKRNEMKKLEQLEMDKLVQTED